VSTSGRDVTADDDVIDDDDDDEDAGVETGACLSVCLLVTTTGALPAVTPEATGVGFITRWPLVNNRNI